MTGIALGASPSAAADTPPTHSKGSVTVPSQALTQHRNSSENESGQELRWPFALDATAAILPIFHDSCTHHPLQLIRNVALPMRINRLHRILVYTRLSLKSNAASYPRPPPLLLLPHAELVPDATSSYRRLPKWVQSWA